jgi:hypothetical protein
MSDDDVDPDLEEFARSFDDKLTEDAVTVLLAVGGEELELRLLREWILQGAPDKDDSRKGGVYYLKDGTRVPSVTAIVSQQSVEEMCRRIRQIARDPDLKKKAEEIILRCIIDLACGRTVNGHMRFSIIGWCCQGLDRVVPRTQPSRRPNHRKAGSPGLGPIERLFRLKTVERIVKENSGAREKTIVTKIMRELGLKERSAKNLKKETARQRGKKDA